MTFVRGRDVESSSHCTRVFTLFCLSFDKIEKMKNHSETTDKRLTSVWLT